MKRLISPVAAMAALWFCCAAMAADEQNTRLIKEAVQGNLAEVKLAELAQANTNSKEIRAFAEMLKSEHAAGLEEARQAAKTLNVTPPSEPTDKQQETYQKLSKLTGEKFDLEFTRTMVDEHKKEIALHEKLAKSSDAAGAYAQKVLPKLRMHLQKAEDLASRHL